MFFASRFQWSESYQKHVIFLPIVWSSLNLESAIGHKNFHSCFQFSPTLLMLKRVFRFLNFLSKWRIKQKKINLCLKAKNLFCFRMNFDVDIWKKNICLRQNATSMATACNVSSGNSWNIYFFTQNKHSSRRILF